MFNIILRVLIFLLVEAIAFYFMMPSNFNISHLPSYFLLWALISFILFFRRLADLSSFSPLGMLGRSNRSAVGLAGEAAKRMIGTDREKYESFKKSRIVSKEYAYLITLIINILFFLIVKLFL